MERKKDRKREGYEDEKKAQIAITLKENNKHFMINSWLFPKDLPLKK